MIFIILWATIGVLLFSAFLVGCCYFGILSRVHRYVFYFLGFLAGPVIWGIFIADVIETANGGMDT